MKYNWSWQVFLEIAPDGIHTYLGTILLGALWTLALAAGAIVIGLMLGSVLGILRTSSTRSLRLLSAAYVELFRNIPLLVQMFLWYFVLPELLPRQAGLALKQMSPPWGMFVPTLLCLGTL